MNCTSYGSAQNPCTTLRHPWQTGSALLTFLSFSHLSRYHVSFGVCRPFISVKRFNILKIQVLPHLQTLELWWRLWISQAGIGQDPCWLTEAGRELLVSHLLSRKAKLPWSEWRTLTTKEKRLKPDIKQQQNTSDFVGIALGVGLTILPGLTEVWSVGRCTVLRCYLFSKTKQVQWEDNCVQKSPISRSQVTIWWLQ